MGYLALGDTVRYHKGPDSPGFATLEEQRTKEASWGETRKIRILGQYDSTEAG